MSISLRDVGPVMLVGVGNMGLAMARGWVDAGLPPSNLILIAPRPSAAAQAFADENGIAIHPEASGLQPNIIVLAVKPKMIESVAESLAPVIGPHTVGVSVAAGIGLDRLVRAFGTGKVVRSMPNTPTQVGKGVTGAVSGPDVTGEDRAKVEALLAAGGIVPWFDDEAAIDVVTAVSGSGPAYVFHMVEALAAAARAQGMDAVMADRLARQTIVGAAALMEADPASATVLRQNVTSPNGTTAAGLSVLMGENGLSDLMTRTVQAARDRAEEMGRD
nr:pyrroline-5-carboxylate reductase [uncultured Devosia sp.]